ncbi:DUF3021 domain-containing protein [Gracilibacillus sp. S3-1-1]|uniref:DUF3021 domain-containing protein n=1 Tax=Gracilibacillus pellucidus TaxID=3095368 RepID=A0ACC6M1B1_9BACI|nr:DUF3021 domain-containing protein [Gracilibacillus sp. S3-1-1]MDX8044678.1 DUF3021 domain-containing protein [Gracilibacillus sp. S3-1-1]
MIVEGLKRILFGVAAGSLITYAVLSLLVFQDVDSSIKEIWKHWSGSMLMGIYYSFASVIFELERWSVLKQTVIHLVLTMIVFFPTAIVIGWIPFNLLSLTIGLAIFLILYSIVWVSVYFRYKNIEKSMNERIDREHQ